MERANEWIPKFKVVQSVEEAAMAINEPHEDFPHRVQRTIDLINSLHNSGLESIDKLLIKAIHSQIFWDEDHRGEWRKVNVTVGNHTPMPRTLVDYAIDEILPVSNYDDLEKRYYDFQTIHPFED